MKYGCTVKKLTTLLFKQGRFLMVFAAVDTRLF